MSVALSLEETALTDRGWFLVYLGDIQVVYMDGRVDDESFTRYARTIEAVADGRPADARVAVVYHVPESSELSAKRRAMIGKVLKSREEHLARTTTAFALATESVLVRGALRVTFWIAPPAYPIAVVPTPRAAFEFVAPHHPGSSASELTATYEALHSKLMPQLGAR